MPLGSGQLTSPYMTRSAKIRIGTLIEIGKNVVIRIGRDNLMLVAAGVAFYSMTAIFPAIAVFVSIYGLFADANSVQDQIAGFSSLLPANSLKLLTDALENFARKSSSSLNVALFVSLGIALWSAKGGISSLMTGLNVANETQEKRSLIVQQAVALGLTIGAILFSMFAIAAVALLPAILEFLPLGDGVKTALGLGRWPLLALLVCFGLAIVYRFGPSREHAKWKWITWGCACNADLAGGLWRIFFLCFPLRFL
jgi:membrane protein